MDDYTKLKTALNLARKLHKNDKDKANDDYIFHPVLVALECESIDEKVVALLHDVIEDHGDEISYDDLLNMGFNVEIIEALKLVTHVRDKSIKDIKIEYREYIKKLKESNNKIAINVILADLKNNSDISRLDGKKPFNYEEYLWAIDYLSKK